MSFITNRKFKWMINIGKEASFIAGSKGTAKLDHDRYHFPPIIDNILKEKKYPVLISV